MIVLFPERLADLGWLLGIIVAVRKTGRAIVARVQYERRQPRDLARRQYDGRVPRDCRSAQYERRNRGRPKVSTGHLTLMDLVIILIIIIITIIIIINNNRMYKYYYSRLYWLKHFTRMRSVVYILGGRGRVRAYLLRRRNNHIFLSVTF